MAPTIRMICAGFTVELADGVEQVQAEKTRNDDEKEADDFVPEGMYGAEGGGDNVAEEKPSALRHTILRFTTVRILSSGYFRNA